MNQNDLCLSLKKPMKIFVKIVSNLQLFNTAESESQIINYDNSDNYCNVLCSYKNLLKICERGTLSDCLNEGNTTLLLRPKCLSIVINLINMQ